MKKFIGIYRNGESIIVYCDTKEEAVEECKNSLWKLLKILQMPSEKFKSPTEAMR